MVRRVVFLTASEQTVVAAAAAFLAQPSLARSTRRSYAQTLTPLMRELGSDRPLSTLTVEAITVAVTTAWGGRAPATWNRQVATVRSFLAFCRRRRWLVEDLTVDLERRPQPADRTKAIPFPELERLWRREDVAVREKALWRLLYETAAGPARPWRSTSRILTWTTSACGSAPRAATPTDCTFRAVRPGCCRG
jgi:site-specific recombinase XerD